MEGKKKSFWQTLLIFLSVLGPGIITGSVDNDAGGITTYSVAGAMYGYNMLWTLVPSTIALLVVQEMNARMGLVAKKGLADMIRENFGIKITFFIFLGLLISNIGNTATEFAGVAGSAEIFGISKYIAVPLVSVAVWILVVKGSYKTAERIFLLFSISLLAYVVSALMAKPNWSEISQAMVHPKMEMNIPYISMVIGIVGTTIAPWMQFYMQSAVIDKGLTIEDYKYEIADVVVGCFVTVIVAFFIIVACGSTLYKNGIVINEAKDAAMALKPFAGEFATQIFAFGLFVASVFSAAILPIATAFFICEAFGFESGLDKTMHEAPQFYTLFTAIMIISAVIILIPNAPLITITIWTQVINGVLLPVILVSMMFMVNNKNIMGKYTNNKFQNVIGWSTIVILIILTLMILVMPFVSKIYNL